MNRTLKSVGRILLENAGFVVLLVAFSSWRFLTGTPLNVRTELTLAGFFVLVTLSNAVQRGLAKANAPVDADEKRIFVGDPETVLELARLTGYDGIRMFTPYLGKWMRISGRYEGRAKSFEDDSIHVSILLNDHHFKENRRINLRFRGDREGEIRNLQSGQRVTANCQIQHRMSGFAPENCELVSAEPLDVKQGQWTRFPVAG